MDTTYSRIFVAKYSFPCDSYQYNTDNADYNRRNFPLLRIHQSHSFHMAHEGPRIRHKKNNNGSVLYSYTPELSLYIVFRQSRDIPQNIHATTVK
jgi:hypothetical protein